MRVSKPIVALGLWISLTAPALAFPNEPTGFHGIAWGTPFAAVQGQMRRMADGNYQRLGDDLTFGTAHLSEIEYLFKDGVFFSALLKSQPDRGADRLLLLQFRIDFGAPTMGQDNVYFWGGSQTLIILNCKELQCSASISGRSANPGNTAAQPQNDLTTQRYRQCMSHCTNMAITCNMNRDDTEEFYKPLGLQCDNQLSTCRADCNQEMNRNWR